MEEHHLQYESVRYTGSYRFTDTPSQVILISSHCVGVSVVKLKAEVAPSQENARRVVETIGSPIAVE